MRPDWLAKVDAVGGVTVVSYIPNNAYIVWLDAKAEQKLRGLLDPHGPLQWIGDYRPSYKIPKSLSFPLVQKDDRTLIDIRVGVVHDAVASRTIDSLPGSASESGKYTFLGMKTVQLNVRPSSITQIAQLSGVLWIERMEPKVLRDENQGLVVASSTNGPGHSPGAGEPGWRELPGVPDKHGRRRLACVRGPQHLSDC